MDRYLFYDLQYNRFYTIATNNKDDINTYFSMEAWKQLATKHKLEIDKLTFEKVKKFDSKDEKVFYAKLQDGYVI